MGHLLTLDIGGTKIATHAYTEAFEPLVSEPTLTPTDSIQSGAGLQKLVVETAAGLPGGIQNLIGVGISVAGTIDPRTGLVHRSPNCPRLDGVILQFELERELAVPVAVENDGNCFTLAEARMGAAKGRGTVIGVTLGTGVGGGIVLTERIHRGSGIGANELGHTCINYDGPECTCGATGCPEGYIGGWAIPRTATQLFELTRLQSRLEGAAITGADLYEAGPEGDEFAKFFWHQYASWLGIAVSNWVNMLRPDAIIFGGSGAASFDLWRDELLTKIRTRVLPPQHERMLVTTAECAHPGNLGAALVLSDRLRKVKTRAL